METIGIEEIIESNDNDVEVEVLVGVAEDTSVDKIDTYCGSDGEVMKEPGFGIARVRLTVSCLRDLKHGGERWIDFIEPAAKETDKTWDTEYEKEYNTS